MVHYFSISIIVMNAMIMNIEYENHFRDDSEEKQQKKDFIVIINNLVPVTFCL